MMPKNNEVSQSVIRRLPRYYRFLGGLIGVGVERISSKELSNLMGLTSSQIRQDLNCFGGFGQQGYGYNVSYLREEIAKILGLDKSQKTIVIGAGNLGRAIISFTDFRGRGFELIGVFDNSPAVIGEFIHNYKVHDISDLRRFCEQNHPCVAILCIPRTSAEKLVSELVDLGIKGFWNFSSYDIALHHPGTAVENVHMSDSLMTLCYKVNDLVESQDE